MVDDPMKRTGGHLLRQTGEGWAGTTAGHLAETLHPTGSPVALPWAQARRFPVGSHHEVDRHLCLVQNVSKTIACLMSLFSFPVTLPSLFCLYSSIAQMFLGPREETSL